MILFIMAICPNDMLGKSLYLLQAKYFFYYKYSNYTIGLSTRVSMFYVRSTEILHLITKNWYPLQTSFYLLCIPSLWQPLLNSLLYEFDVLGLFC